MKFKNSPIKQYTFQLWRACARERVRDRTLSFYRRVAAGTAVAVDATIVIVVAKCIARKPNDCSYDILYGNTIKMYYHRTRLPDGIVTTITSTGVSRKTRRKERFFCFFLNHLVDHWTVKTAGCSTLTYIFISPACYIYLKKIFYSLLRVLARRSNGVRTHRPATIIFTRIIILTR